MVGEVLAGLSGFKTMLDMAKALKDINDATVRNGAVIELQEQILAAQAQQSALVDQVRDLEREITNLKTWDAERQRYELKVVANGAFAYTLKPEAQGGEPPHQICAACYEHQKKSILQIVAGNRASASLGIPRMYRCPECQSEILAGSG